MEGTMSRPMGKLWRLLLTLTVLLVLNRQVTFADGITTWTGGTTGAWGSTGSWDTGIVPDNNINPSGSPFTATLQNPFGATLDYGPVNIDTLNMSGSGTDAGNLYLNGYTLSVDNALTLTGSQTLNGTGTLSASTASNSGTLALAGGANLSVTNAFDNS